MKTFIEWKLDIETFGVHPILGPTGSNGWIEQNPTEFATFLIFFEGLIQKESPKLLEIGMGHMGGLIRFLKQKGWQTYGIDINRPQTSLEGITHIIASSHSPEAIAFAQQYAPYDLVFIDADHSYEAAMQDFHDYASMGKVVAFHDIAGLRNCEGSQKLWRDLAYQDGKLKDGWHEMIVEGERGAGIGWCIQ